MAMKMSNEISQFKCVVRLIVKMDKILQKRMFDPFSIRLFNGLHPKNIFHFRSKFLGEFLSPNDRVIDIASGTGSTLNYLHNLIEAGLGIEKNEKHISFSRRLAPKNINFEKNDILKLDYVELSKKFKYNVAIFSHILEHLENPSKIMKSVNAEKVIVCVPSEENWYRQLLKYLDMDYRSDPDHFREYSRETLRKDIKNAGYAIDYLGFNPEGEIVGVGIKDKHSC